jgi:hypothetical protein
VRAVLAANGALVGAFLAFGLQRASVSNDANAEDPRVLLPLLTLGMGTGLGASLLAAEEWVTLEDYLFRFDRVISGAVRALHCNFCLSGFGIGLTWAAVIMKIGQLKFNKLINYTNGKIN